MENEIRKGFFKYFFKKTNRVIHTYLLVLVKNDRQNLSRIQNQLAPVVSVRKKGGSEEN